MELSDKEQFAVLWKRPCLVVHDGLELVHSDVLRILGNEAAHGDDINYDERIVKEMINFTQIIIEYVYVIPYRLGNIKKNIAKKKSLNQSVNS